ncbi:MAG: bifunctional oligoribonuclease/PAP phosphatase NrnA [Lachnospiraceae bacterium]|nr:bifunctional oligoribonuclease/PAP phosphatase NrnA [Lachnospiraceae bacterium]
MNEAIKKNILNTIKSYDKIIITRHQRPDGDALGSTRGLAGILRASFPEKDIRLLSEDRSEELAFLGPEDETPPDSFYEGALVIVLDTGTKDRIANGKIHLAAEVIKIDHHPANDLPYGDICWIEEGRSSICEMIVDFYVSFKDELILTPEAATALYTGMVTDSGRFRFPSVTGDTLRLAAVLLDQGIDTESLFARLYMEDYEFFKYEAYVYEHMERTENGVAYLFVTRDMQERFGLGREAASNTIGLMDSIKGCLIWLAFIDNGDGSIRVRLRSRFTEVQPLAARYGGGGHDRASGATVHSWEEALKMVAEADAQLGEYKATHEGWL